MMAPPRLVEMIGHAAMRTPHRQQPVMGFAPETHRAMDHPPEAQAHRPEEVEVLRGVGPVSVGSKLRLGSGVDARLHQPQQSARAFPTLHDAFRRQQPAVHAQHPEQAPHPGRQQRCRALLGRKGLQVLRPLLAAGLAQQPIRDGPKRARQGEIVPEINPGSCTVETVRQPGKERVIVENQLGAHIRGPRIQRAHQTIDQDRNGQQREPEREPGRPDEVDLAHEVLPVRNFRIPPRRLKTLEVPDGQLDRQQQSGNVAGHVHHPNGPRLGRAKGPGTEDHHEIHQRPGQIVTQPVEQDVPRP